MAPPSPYRFGACSWSSGLSLLDSIPWARTVGLNGVEIDPGPAQPRLPLSDAAARNPVRAAVATSDIAISTICAVFLNDYPMADDPSAESWVLQCIESATFFGADVVLLPFFGKGDLRDGTSLRQPQITRVIERLRRVMPQAERAGVSIALETTLNARDQLDIVDKIGSDHAKVYFDIGNANYFGYDPATEIRQLGKRMARIHFKDAGYLGEPNRIDLSRVAAALEDIEYQGWLVLETNCPSGDATADFKRNLATLRTAVGV